MDDGYLEQFPIGAINHIGLPESTLPKEVRSYWNGVTSPQHRFHSVTKDKLHAPTMYGCRALQVIQVLPSDYYAQLEVAHHISCYAFSSKVRLAVWGPVADLLCWLGPAYGAWVQVKAMEAENQQLKQALTQKTSQVKTLESRLTSTQLDLQDSQEKVSFLTVHFACIYLLQLISLQAVTEHHCIS